LIIKLSERPSNSVNITHCLNNLYLEQREKEEKEEEKKGIETRSTCEKNSYNSGRVFRTT
jgi:hypothetical protein